MKSLFALMVIVQIFNAVISRILSMILKFLSTRIFDFEYDLLLIIVQRTMNLVYLITWMTLYF